MGTKFLKIILIILVILGGIIIGSLYVYREYKISKLNLPDYYKNLARKCKIIDLPFLMPTSCCLDSVETMANGNYRPTSNGCSEGFKGVCPMCTGGFYCFCVPKEKIGELFQPFSAQSGDVEPLQYEIKK